MKIDTSLTAGSLQGAMDRFWAQSGQKILAIEKRFDTSHGAPVFTVNGKYTTRGWTEWTQGFQFGSALLQFDATGERQFLDIGRKNTIGRMAPHLTHQGVHDHGFNNLSTYGNLLRLMQENKIPLNEREKDFYRLAIMTSGAVQAMRWTPIRDGGFIYSFNGPHSLFVDTIRSCRILMLAHAFGHYLGGENDARISLLQRAVQHLKATAQYSIYYGEGRDHYDVTGRTAHESIFNVRDGTFRCPNSQQGYSGWTTWTRGLAWAMCGFAEELEFVERLDDRQLEGIMGKKDLLAMLLKAATATCDFYLHHTCTDGIPFWDTGAPGLHRLGDYYSRPSDPYNDHEPVDSSAAAIGAQGLLRLGNFLVQRNDAGGENYVQAGLTVARTLTSPPYLSSNEEHEGLLLHSVYHRPNGWDHIPKGRRIPCDESSMWGDYHLRELMLLVGRMVRNEQYNFYGCLEQ